MTLTTNIIKRSLPEFDLITTSLVISCLFACYGILIYPHRADAGGVGVHPKTVIETILFLSFSLFAAARILSWKPILERTVLTKPLICLTGLLCISAALGQNLVQSIETVTLYFAYVCCFFIFVSVLRGSTSQLLLAYCIVLISFYVCIAGLFDYNYLNIVNVLFVYIFFPLEWS